MDTITRICSEIVGSKNKTVISYLDKNSQDTIVCNKGNNDYLGSFFKDSSVSFISENELYDVGEPHQIIFMYKTNQQDYLHFNCNVVEIINTIN
jgi:hypothetical protein